MLRKFLLTTLLPFCWLSSQASTLPEACEFFITKATSAQAQNQKDSVEIFLSQALGSLSTQEDSILCYTTFGRALYKEKHYGAASSGFEEAIKFERNDLPAIVEALYFQAKALEKVGGKVLRIIKLYERSVYAADQLNTSWSRYFKGNSLLKLGQHYIKVGDAERAIAYYQQALTIGQEPALQKNNIDVRALIELGTAYENKKEFETAIAYNQQAIDIDYAKLRYKGIAFSNMGDFYLELGKYEDAILSYDTAEAIFLDIDKMAYYFITKGSRGNAYLKKGQLQKAEQILVNAIQGHKTINEQQTSREEAKMWLALGNTYKLQQKYEDALHSYQKALVHVSLGPLSADPTANPPKDSIYAENVFQDGLNGKGEIFLLQYSKTQSLENLGASFDAFSLAMAADDALRKEYSLTSSKSDLAAETHWRTGLALEAAYELESTLKTSYLDTVFALMEHSRAMDIYGTLVDAQARSSADISAALEEQLITARTNLAACKARWTADSTVHVASVCAKAQHQYDSLMQVVEAADPSYRFKKYQLQMHTLGEVQQKLGAGEAVVEYLWGDSSVFGLMITPDRADWKRLGTSNEIAKWVESLPKAGRFATSQIEALHALYKLLLAAFDSLPQRLILIPDGPLHSLPFEALLTQLPSKTHAQEMGSKFWKGEARLPGGASYLLFEHEVQYAQSATLLFGIPARQQAHIEMAVFAPDYPEGAEFEGSPISSFAKTKKHLRALKKSWGIESFEDEQADSLTFFQQASEFRMLHLVMHGFANEKEPMMAALAFGGTDQKSGIVRAASLYGLPPLQAELVSLLSCETGKGQYAKGEGIMSLARAFRYSGAQSVLMSLWKADTKAGMAIMEEFYRNLAEGKDRVSALNLAKRSYLSEGDDIDVNPTKWANFVLIGQGSAISPSEPKSIWRGRSILFILAGLVLLSFFFWRMRKNISN